MSHPLISGEAAVSQFETLVKLPPFQANACLASPVDIHTWISKLTVNVSAQKILFGYTAGTMEAATPEDRDRPRFMFDGQGRYLGLALWMPEIQGWTLPGQVGQLMTLRRLANTVADDLAARPLAGWKLCDGTTPSLPNLTQKTTLDVFNTANPPVKSGTVEVPSQWFAGSSPNWDTYTVGYVGA